MGLGEAMGIQALMRNEKTAKLLCVYVTPSISIFGNIWKFVWVSMRQSPSWCQPKPVPRQDRGQKMKAVTSILAVGKSGFPDSYPAPYPSTFSPLSTGKGAQWVALSSPPTPLPFTEIALLGNNPQAVLCSWSLWTPSRRQDPRGQESKGKSNHLHVLLYLIIFKKILQCFICSWTALQYPAINLKWIHSTQKDGMRVTLI